MKPARIRNPRQPGDMVVSSHARNNERILAHGTATRPERVEPTSQALIRHRGTGCLKGQLETVGRWPKEREQRHLDRPGCFRAAWVTGALLFEISDSVPYGTPSLPGELKNA